MSNQIEQIVCKRCIMDTTVPDIVFYDDGTCSVCRDFEAKVAKNVFTGEKGESVFKNLILKLKEDGKNKNYDCVVGVSGGLDSTYLVYVLWKAGIKPLLLHIDGGWDSQLSSKNISNMIDITGFDITEVVLPIAEFTDIINAYMKADVVDVEAPFDHIVPYYLYKLAETIKTKHIIIGSNTLTEGFMPQSWRFDKADAANIKDIHKKHGTIPMKKFPTLNPWKTFIWYRLLKKINIHKPLDWIGYNRDDAIEAVKNAFGWVDYGGKNYEFLFTRFDKAFLQPMKFGIDKRKALYSGQIMRGIITREQALKKMSEPAIDENELNQLKNLFCLKTKMTKYDLNNYILRPVKSHYDYKHGVWIHRTVRLLKWLKKKFR